MPTPCTGQIRFLSSGRAASAILVLLVLPAAALAGAAAALYPPDRSFTVAATEYDRGNVRVFADQYADAGPMVAYGGESPIVVEYDIDFPVDGAYTLDIRYAAAASRPVEVYIDETKLGDYCRPTTGGWMTSRAATDRIAIEYLPPGKHTIKLQRSGAFPHVVSLTFTASRPFPNGWKLERKAALETVTTAALAGPPATQIDPAALRNAIIDLSDTFGDRYAGAAGYLERLDVLTSGAPHDGEERKRRHEDLAALAREALLHNPLLDFDELLLVKRPQGSPSLGLPRNWQSNCSLPAQGFDDSMIRFDLRNGNSTNVYRAAGRFLGDVDLHADGARALFSSTDPRGRWQLFEVGLDGRGLRQVTGEQGDVDSYDGCYLPNGRILFTSTACFVGVPCVYGSSHVANLYSMEADGTDIRQLCFDQEHDWCPTVLNNGRVLYSRWEYADTPHAHTRLLFHMNPDGTEQFEYYSSNSYWPNSIFYARPVPNHATKVVAVIGGHHDNPRMGELVIFDPARGRRENEGAVQRIPGHGREVEAVISDGLTRQSWPKFLHPFPLSEKYYLVAARPSPTALWGIYLVDVFDNMVLIAEQPGYALLEPLPLRPTALPPIVPEKVDRTRKDAEVFIADIYTGPGLQGIPRGTVKRLRIFTYHYAYQGMGGLLGVVGIDGPWDVKRIMGTVPVHADGSARFRVPANTPISLQPLDQDGQALQLMRSWMTAMPGETVQCAGCHEPQNSAPAIIDSGTLAMENPPDEITPWYGPTRGFSYAREVQPVIDRYCVDCHDGSNTDGRSMIDLRGHRLISDFRQVSPGTGGARGGRFSVGYAELHRFVRRPGIESDYHLLEPMEFHAGTTELVQLLRQGHYGVNLDRESWDRLITWIDLNCPYHGNWSEATADPAVQRQRRRELLLRYGGVDDDPEALPPLPTPRDKGGSRQLAATPAAADTPPATGQSPVNAQVARRRQAALAQAIGQPASRTVDLGGGQSLALVLVPPGQLLTHGHSGQGHARAVEEAYWLGSHEVTNAQYAQFDPRHDSRIESKNSYQFGVHGYPMNRPEQPVVRVSWDEAMRFCQWLSERTGEQFSLPSETEWEWACRAGAESEFWYGTVDSDFGAFANLSDRTMTLFASDPYTVDVPLKDPTKYDDWIPKQAKFNDGSLLTVAPGRYRPNAWGLYDMHGNASEWTATATGDRSLVVRGGSWYDRPYRATSTFRLSYRPYQRVFNVGFRVSARVPKAAVAAK